MRSEFCNNCQRYTGSKRYIGVGTLIMVLLTFGAWLLVIPFYQVRCTVCGCSRFARILYAHPSAPLLPESTENPAPDHSSKAWIILGVVGAGILVIWLLAQVTNQ